MNKQNIFDKIKKIVCLIFAILFYLIGIVGLIIPIIPQVPFFIIGTVFMIVGFKSFKIKIMESKFYKKYIEENVNKNKFLKGIFSKEN